MRLLQRLGMGVEAEGEEGLMKPSTCSMVDALADFLGIEDKEGLWAIEVTASRDSHATVTVRRFASYPWPCSKVETKFVLVRVSEDAIPVGQVEYLA